MEARLVEQIVSILINYILLVINFLYVRIIIHDEYLEKDNAEKTSQLILGPLVNVYCLK